MGTSEIIAIFCYPWCSEPTIYITFFLNSHAYLSEVTYDAPWFLSFCIHIGSLLAYIDRKHLLLCKFRVCEKKREKNCTVSGDKCSNEIHNAVKRNQVYPAVDIYSLHCLSRDQF